MSIDTLEFLSIAFYIAAVVFFLVAVALFFLFKIPETIGFLTGSNRQKGIAQLQKQSQETLDAVPLTGSGRMRTGNLSKTEKIFSMPGLKNDNQVSKSTVQEQTELLVENTTVLTFEQAVPNNISNVDCAPVGESIINILVDITFIHTSEIIE